MPDRARRLSVPAALSALLGVVMLASRNGLLHVGYASPALSPSGSLNDYGFTTLVLLEGVGGAFVIYLAYLVLSGPKNAPPADRGLLTPVFFLVVFVGAIIFSFEKFGHRGTSGGLALHVKQTASPPATALPAPASAPIHPPSFRWSEVLVVGGLVAAIAVALAAAYAVHRHRAADAPPGLRRRGTAELEEALDRGVDDLRTEPDLRRAIIAAYARMERALGSRRLPRERWETPLEYLARVLVGLDASRASVERLTHLFEWAKFSNHRPDEPMRDEAISALEAVRAELHEARP